MSAAPVLLNRMKTKIRLIPLLGWIVLGLLAASAGRADEETEQARALLEKYRGCVVAVQAVAELHLSAASEGRQKAAPDRDVPVAGVATIVGREGVLVSAYSFFDASSLLDGRTITGPGGKKATIEVGMGAIKEVKVVLRDGTEVPAEVLLKDPPSDLIVLRADAAAWAKAGGDRLPAVDLANQGEAELLDNLLIIGLSGPSFGRETMAARSGILVKAVKPRLVYRPSFAQKGGPAFLLDGRLLGLGAQQLYRDKLTNDPVIVPAADVAEIVRQAMAEPAGSANR